MMWFYDTWMNYHACFTDELLKTFPNKCCALVTCMPGFRASQPAIVMCVGYVVAVLSCCCCQRISYAGDVTELECVQGNGGCG